MPVRNGAAALASGPGTWGTTNHKADGLRKATGRASEGILHQGDEMGKTALLAFLRSQELGLQY